RRALRRPPLLAAADRAHLECAHTVGRLYRARRDSPFVAACPHRALARRLRRGARGGASRRAQPFTPLLEPPRAALSRLARGPRAPRAFRPYTAHPERETMRFLHTMLRVGDMQRSVRFYTEVLGMKLLRTTDRPDQKYSLAFVGYDSEERSAVLELTYNYGVARYDLGGAYGHVAIRSEEHTSELQSRENLVCRLLLEK